jgi:hypothetical protein
VPIDSRELILVREVVSHLASKGFLQYLTESFSKMLSRGCNNQLTFFIHFPPHNPAQRVVDRSAFSFFVEEMFDLLVV